MASELDTLMDLDPLELTAKDLDKVVAYHRESRAKRESGVKPSREAGPKLKISSDILDGLLKDKPKAAEPTLKRRI